MTSEPGKLRRGLDFIWHKIGYVILFVAVVFGLCYYNNWFGVTARVDTTIPVLGNGLTYLQNLFVNNAIIKTYVLSMPWAFLWGCVIGGLFAWQGYKIFVIGLRRLGYRQTINELGTQPSGWTPSHSQPVQPQTQPAAVVPPPQEQQAS